MVGGKVIFHGRDMVRLGRGELRNMRWREYSIVMQSAMNALNPMKSIGAQFKDTLQAHGSVSTEEIRRRSTEVMNLVGIDAAHLDSYPHQLSGGMRQRAMIAMALLFTPQLVIMDEPTSALDVVAQQSLMTKIKELQQSLGFAVIFVTHDMSVVSRYSDRVLVMYAGQIAEAARTDAIFERPLHPYTRGLMNAFPSVTRPAPRAGRDPRKPAGPGPAAQRLPLPPALPRGDADVPEPRTRAVPGRRCRRSLPAVCRAGEGGGLRMARPDEPPRNTPDAGGAPAASGRSRPGTSASAGCSPSRSLHAVDDFNLNIDEREIVALVGESGSGKSTVARLLARIYHAHPRRDLLPWPAAPRPALAQGPALVPGRGGDRLPGPVQRVQSGVSRLARGDAQPRAAQAGAGSAPSAEARPSACVESVGLSPKMLTRFPYEMSGGERQRVGFAQALAVQPKLILADEPVSMLDVSIRVGVLNMMAGLRDQEGVSILYITHDLASARYVADRVIVMYAGHLVEAGPTETVLSDPKHPYTQLLLSAVADPRDKDEEISADSGEPPRVINPSEGCRFRWRCPYAIEKCALVTPRPDPDRSDAGRLPRRGRTRRSAPRNPRLDHRR